MTSQEFFQFFTYAANYDIQLNLVFLFGGLLYLFITGPLVHKIPHAKPVALKTKMFFLFGWSLYYIALGSPLNLLAHELFSMHMMQMSILYIAMPPFLLLGLPAWVFHPLAKIRWVRRIGGFLTRPLIILFLFNGLISIYHFPYIFDTIMTNVFLHDFSHFLLLFLALCMWWPIVCPIPEQDKVKPLHKLAFIFANGILLTPACALIMFSDDVLFSTYAQMSAMVPIMSPHHDQVLGGVIMKIMQEVVYISAIGIVFARWFRIQRKQDEQEMLEWTDGVTQEPAMAGKQGS